tara:strand:+ start:751 stop:1848 length:1098 start_codon:yes stop_codon:yes gene_type:complete
MMLYQRQSGFTLVELMVAMAIGTLIILGAGQLFLTTFQTFKKVDELSRKQETVVFASTSLVNNYRKSEREYSYSLDETTGSPNECSITRSSNGANPQPIVSGLALFEGECDSDRFVEAIDLEIEDGQILDGYRRFTLDFERQDSELETLSFHVMERKFGESEGYVLLSGADITISGAPAILGNVHAEGDITGIERSETVTSVGAGDASVSIPNVSAFITQVSASEQVQKACAINVMSSPVVYCNGAVSGDFSTIRSEVKLVVASGSVIFQKSNTEDVSANVSIVAGGAVAIGAGSGWGDIEFNGLIWAGGNAAFYGDSNSTISGSMIVGETVDQISGVSTMHYRDVTGFFNVIRAIDGVNTPSFP